METITILLDKGEQGAPRVQLVPSSGVASRDGLDACWRAMQMFQRALIAEEAERLAAEMCADEDGEEADE